MLKKVNEQTVGIKRGDSLWSFQLNGCKIQTESPDSFAQLVYPNSMRKWAWKIGWDFLLLNNQVLSFHEQVNGVEVFSILGERQRRIEFSDAIFPVDAVQETDPGICWFASASAGCVYRVDLQSGRTLATLGFPFSDGALLKCPVALDWCGEALFILDGDQRSVCKYVQTEGLTFVLDHPQEEVVDIVVLGEGVKVLETLSSVCIVQKNGEFNRIKL